MTKYLALLRVAIVAGLFMAGTLMISAPVAAQDATQVAGEAAAQAEEVVNEDDGGFEWGLLGLLGLAGLAGLMRRPKPVVHDIDRTTTRASTSRIDDRGPNDRTV